MSCVLNNKENILYYTLLDNELLIKYFEGRGNIFVDPYKFLLLDIEANFKQKQIWMFPKSHLCKLLHFTLTLVKDKVLGHTLVLSKNERLAKPSKAVSH